MALKGNTFNTSAISKLNGLAGGLASSALSYGLTGEATFNVLNIADFGSSASCGLLEVSVGNNGIKTRLGTGGTDISAGTLISAYNGIKESSKVLSWKYGSIEKRSTLNSINMMGYTNVGGNQKLSKDIWNEKITVNYTDTGKDYGNYKVGDDKIRLRKDLLGGGREESAKLATVMSHEGTHAYGNRIEGIAHLTAAQTYSQLNSMFGLKGDSSFGGEMLAGIMKSENWKENVGDEDHWRVHKNGEITWDGQLNFYMEGETDKEDAEAGKVLDYRDLKQLLKESKKTRNSTITFGIWNKEEDISSEGIDVDVSRLKEIYKINNDIVKSGKNTFGQYNSFAAEALLTDGFMSYSSAVEYGNEIKNRLLGGSINGPNMIEHYSVRYILNDNDNFLNYFSDEKNIEAWTSNVIKGYSEKEFVDGIKAKLLKQEESIYHGFEKGKYSYKWCFDDGREIVFNPVFDSHFNSTQNYKLEMDYRFLGTYNWFEPSNKKMHSIADVIPYGKWGNTPEDKGFKWYPLFPEREEWKSKENKIKRCYNNKFNR